MKRVCLLACCAVLSGCMHAAPVEVKKEAPAPAVKQEKPELSAALLSEAIVKGKTTWQELVAKLGPPNSVVKHPAHLPRITDPEQLQKLEKLKKEMEITPEMFAAETWNYWTIKGGMRTILVEVYMDENKVVLDYKINGEVVRP